MSFRPGTQRHRWGSDAAGPLGPCSPTIGPSIEWPNSSSTTGLPGSAPSEMWSPSKLEYRQRPRPEEIPPGRTRRRLGQGRWGAVTPLARSSGCSEGGVLAGRSGPGRSRAPAVTAPAGEYAGCPPERGVVAVRQSQPGQGRAAGQPGRSEARYRLARIHPPQPRGPRHSTPSTPACYCPVTASPSRARRPTPPTRHATRACANSCPAD